MNEKKKSPAIRIWYVVYPFLFYYAVSIIAMSVCMMVIGTQTSHFVACQLIATAVTIPFMLPFYRQDRALEGKSVLKITLSKELLVHIGSALLITACLSMALNNLISMTPLVTVSAGYQEANANFYGSTLILELISSAVLTPILEELVFRGILFGRLKTMLPKIWAIIISSLIFAVVHFNIVQFIYAFLIGLVLAVFADRADHVYPAIAGHIAANLIAVLRTETGIFASTMDGSVFAWIISVVLLTTGSLFLTIYLKKFAKK